MLRFRTLRRLRSGADVRRLEKVAEFHRLEFPSSAQFLDSLRARLEKPLRVEYAATLVTAEEADGQVLGFAFYDHFPDLNLSYLEYIVTGPSARGRGVGGGLYEAMRESLLYDGSDGLVFETNPDDENLPTEQLASNRATLRFYEKYDARPLESVRFDYPPFQETGPQLVLMHDDLGRGVPLTGARLRAFVKKLYRVKYGVDPRHPAARRILGAIPDGALTRRPLRYVKPERAVGMPIAGRRLTKVEAVIAREVPPPIPGRDRVERPLRMARLLAALDGVPHVVRHAARTFPDRHLLAVHDRKMVRFLQNACASLGEGESIQPSVFPARARVPVPGGQPTLAGYFCLDTFTPLTREAYPAAREAVDVALTAAERLRAGVPDGPVYALTRPPGHHAERDLFGGFCYLNHVAVAAHHLSARGRVAVLDLDFHHGNGAQQIFYGRDDVLTVSIHGDPSSAYPYFTGFAHEQGEGAGKGCNVNLPLPSGIGDDAHRAALEKACAVVARFEPDHLVVALGLDASKDDPSGSWRITRKGFQTMGRVVAELGVPTMLTQEGGYNLRDLGRNLQSFFVGWAQADGLPLPKREKNSTSLPG